MTKRINGRAPLFVSAAEEPEAREVSPRKERDSFTRSAKGTAERRPQLFSKESAWLKEGLSDERPARTLLMNTLKDASISAVMKMDRTKLLGTFSDPKKAFAEYCKMRLAVLPDSLRAPAEKYVTERVVALSAKRLSGQGRSFGYFNPEQKRLELRFPQSLRGSLLEYVTIAHEWEHAIQKLALDANRVPLETFTFQAWGEHRFWTECGAMAAEGAFTSLMSRKSLDKGLEQLRKSKDVEPDVLPPVSRMLQGGGADLLAYVRGEHAAGRYDRTFCMKSVLPG